VHSQSQLIYGFPSGDLEGNLTALECIIKYFIAHNLLNCGQLMPVHLAQMSALEHEEPMIWEALKSRDFVVAKSEMLSTRLFTDQTLPQENKVESLNTDVFEQRTSAGSLCSCF